MTPRHLSMLRSYTPADGLTIATAACGTITVFLCLNYLPALTRVLPDGTTVLRSVGR